MSKGTSQAEVTSNSEKIKLEASAIIRLCLSEELVSPGAMPTPSCSLLYSNYYTV